MNDDKHCVTRPTAQVYRMDMLPSMSTYGAATIGCRVECTTTGTSSFAPGENRVVRQVKEVPHLCLLDRDQTSPSYSVQLVIVSDTPSHDIYSVVATCDACHETSLAAMSAEHRRIQCMALPTTVQLRKPRFFTDGITQPPPSTKVATYASKEGPFLVYRAECDWSKLPSCLSIVAHTAGTSRQFKTYRMILARSHADATRAKQDCEHLTHVHASKCYCGEIATCLVLWGTQSVCIYPEERSEPVPACVVYEKMLHVFSCDRHSRNSSYLALSLTSVRVKLFGSSQ